jgi:hypothetical protein
VAVSFFCRDSGKWWTCRSHTSFLWGRSTRTPDRCNPHLTGPNIYSARESGDLPFSAFEERCSNQLRNAQSNWGTPKSSQHCGSFSPRFSRLSSFAQYLRPNLCFHRVPCKALRCKESMWPARGLDSGIVVWN